MLPEIYPRPVAFYQHPAFEGERGELLPPDPSVTRTRFFGADENLRRRILCQLDGVKFRRIGRLRGQYILQMCCLLAFDRHGTPISLNTDAADDVASPSMLSRYEALILDPGFPAQRDAIIGGWNEVPMATNLVVLGGHHATQNFYHFSVRLLPPVRHFADDATTCVGLPESCVTREYQRSLLRLTIGARRILPVPDGLRVEDPWLVYEPVNAAAVRWLRERTGLRARRGGRMIYIARRPSPIGRTGGCIQPTAAFCSFLRRHGFEIVDFGMGDVALTDQVAMLDGARVILSAHGANLTNIAYLDAGVSVIEIMPVYWAFASHIQISAAAGLNHFVVVCHTFTEALDLDVDVACLEEALAAAKQEVLF